MSSFLGYIALIARIIYHQSVTSFITDKYCQFCFTKISEADFNYTFYIRFHLPSLTEWFKNNSRLENFREETF